MKNLTVIAEGIALEAHDGQLYGTRNYVDAHVEPVADLIARLGYGEQYQLTGWLHDVLEDSDFTTADLLERSIPQNVVDAVELLTRKSDQNHKVYLNRIAMNGLAVVGKFADSSINFSNTVLNTHEADEVKVREMLAKYAGNLAFLFPLLPSPE